MTKLIHKEDHSVIGVVSLDNSSYIGARKQIEQKAQKHGLRVADMPSVIRALSADNRIRTAIRPHWINTLTAEVHGRINECNIYQVQHIVGDLNPIEGLVNARPKMTKYGFMPARLIASNDGLVIGLNDLRKGNVPKAGTPHTISLDYPDDYKLISLGNDMKEVMSMYKAEKLIIFENGQLNRHQFMIDDRVAAIAGSSENVELMAKILYTPKSDGGEGWKFVGSYHRIAEIGFPEKSTGRPAFLGGNNRGLRGRNDITHDGCFLGVGDGDANARDITSSGIVAPSLEQILAIVSRDVSYDEKERQIRSLYKQ